MKKVKFRPTLISGMHRSGTSMVANLLRDCGLSLGPENRLLPPGEGNPTGFWENLDMDAVTEEILTTLAGDWDFLLPPMPRGWVDLPELERAREMAAEASALLAENAPWGWKDPRATLVIPFWKAELPDLQTVVVLRHPAEVTRSLIKRVDCTIHTANHLWTVYAEHILADTTADERIVTHYDSYFLDPLAELRRLTDWLGLDADDALLTAAANAISTVTREQRAENNDPIPSEMAALYDALLSETSDQTQAAVAAGTLPRPVAMATPPQLPDSRVTAALQEQSQTMHDEALTLINQEQAVAAIAKLREAATLDPHNASVHNDLAVMLMQAGEASSAETHFNLANQIMPNNPDTVANMARAYLQLGRVESAIKLYLGFFEQKPSHPGALAWLAVVADETGSESNARKYAEKLREIESDNMTALTLLDKFNSPQENR